jgi:hypothetical protein
MKNLFNKKIILHKFINNIYVDFNVKLRFKKLQYYILAGQVAAKGPCIVVKMEKGLKIICSSLFDNKPHHRSTRAIIVGRRKSTFLKWPHFLKWE